MAPSATTPRRHSASSAKGYPRPARARARRASKLAIARARCARVEARHRERGDGLRLEGQDRHGGFAENYGARPDMLTDWKKRDEFWLLAKDFRSAFLKETILDAAIRAANGDSFNDRKLLLEMAQEYLPVTRREMIGRDGGPVQVQTLVGIVQEARQQETAPQKDDAELS